MIAQPVDTAFADKYLSLRSQGIYDGWILEKSETGNQGGLVNSIGNTIYVGDSAFDRQYRSILSFNTAGLPDTAVITRVTLRVKRQGVVGTNPFSTHGKLLLDIKKGSFTNKPILQSTDFQAAATMNAAGILGNKLLIGNWYQSILKGTALQYINKKGITQFRLRFQKDDNDDGGADYLKIFSGNHSTVTYRPLLIVDYYIPGSISVPPVKASWQIQYSGEIDLSLNVDVYNLDLFETSAADIASLHERGIYVMCYFSAGSWESWRPDAKLFPSEVLGNNYAGWPGEKWLDIRAINKLAPIMKARVEQAAQKRCDGIDPDNVNGYENKTGFPLTYQHQLNFNTWLAQSAHSRGLAIGLKNDLNQISDLLSQFDWALNEECFSYNECNLLKPFLNIKKPVFVVEYEMLPVVFCPRAKEMGINAIYKNWELNKFRLACP